LDVGAINLKVFVIVDPVGAVFPRFALEGLIANITVVGIAGGPNFTDQFRAVDPAVLVFISGLITDLGRSA